MAQSSGKPCFGGREAEQLHELASRSESPPVERCDHAQDIRIRTAMSFAGGVFPAVHSDEDQTESLLRTPKGGDKKIRCPAGPDGPLKRHNEPRLGDWIGEMKMAVAHPEDLAVLEKALAADVAVDDLAAVRKEDRCHMRRKLSCMHRDIIKGMAPERMRCQRVGFDLQIVRRIRISRHGSGIRSALDVFAR